MNAAKKITALIAALAAAALGGCSTVENTTPKSMPENPSRTYTLSMKVDLNDGDVSQESFKPYIVIDAQARPMDHKGGGVYVYDYVMPLGRNSAKYYFQFEYDINKIASGIPAPRRLKSSEVYEFTTESKYVVSLESARGNVGSKITLLGKGFTEDDKILVGGVEAKTDFISDSTLNFTVPPLESSKSYKVELAAADKKITIGDFRVDDAALAVSPSYLNLRSGETASLTFNIGFRAPAEGFVIDVKTNVPSSLIMGDVVVPAGKRSVTVPIKAGARGNGFIYINAFGFKEAAVPLTVK